MNILDMGLSCASGLYLVVIKHTVDRLTAGARRLIGYKKRCLLFPRDYISLPLFCIVCILQLFYCSEHLVILFSSSHSLSALQSEKYPFACTCRLFGCLLAWSCFVGILSLCDCYSAAKVGEPKDIHYIWTILFCF